MVKWRPSQAYPCGLRINLKAKRAKLINDTSWNCSHKIWNLRGFKFPNNLQIDCAAGTPCSENRGGAMYKGVGAATLTIQQKKTVIIVNILPYTYDSKNLHAHKATYVPLLSENTKPTPQFPFLPFVLEPTKGTQDGFFYTQTWICCCSGSQNRRSRGILPLEPTVQRYSFSRDF